MTVLSELLAKLEAAGVGLKPTIELLPGSKL